ncbi:hypothetical protein [Marilutibacter chinensis]|uniref:EF-hand domain-containing protein n=1 Tax=Marilutibacter chinensis TaxID=2912247 RepID=A0ABS9HUV8_9GAMM|nr:hypothetical protein [Lysobacter chinensis]MCF7222478.1 hypothetical protein [Lysobacter chinensis]
MSTDAPDKCAPGKHASREQGPCSSLARAGPAAAGWLVAFASIAYLPAPHAQTQERAQEQQEQASPVESEEAPPVPPAFADLDRNGDGQLTREEAAADAALTLRFDDADLNEDGLLTPTEHASIDDEPPVP